MNSSFHDFKDDQRSNFPAEKREIPLIERKSKTKPNTETESDERKNPESSDAARHVAVQKLSFYWFGMDKRLEILREKFPEKDKVPLMKDVNKILRFKWRQLSQVEKQPYIEIGTFYYESHIKKSSF